MSEPIDACNPNCWLRKEQEKTIDKLYEMRERFLERDKILSEVERILGTKDVLPLIKKYQEQNEWYQKENARLEEFLAKK